VDQMDSGKGEPRGAQRRGFRRFFPGVGQGLIYPLIVVVIGAPLATVATRLTHTWPFRREGTPKVSIKCNGLPRKNGVPQKRVRPGEILTLTFHTTAPAEAVVGLGAALYSDDTGDDVSEGYGDEDKYSVKQGTYPDHRVIRIPPGVSPGSYEVVAEIWPKDHIGRGETIDDNSCGYVMVT
jgi:hypothetical protein